MSKPLTCPYWDCGWCYVPEGVEKITNTGLDSSCKGSLECDLYQELYNNEDEELGE